MTCICVHTWICELCGALESQSATIDGNASMAPVTPMDWHIVNCSDVCENCFEDINYRKAKTNETPAPAPPAADARVGESSVFTDSLRERGFFGER